ncbi:hypothetical protein [Streptomyces sp. NPDC056190]|uniref:hypothetical protein n=1 Tax=unclassified Streptomyces TaxID=2593676 RepID=UPI0035E0C587
MILHVDRAWLLDVAHQHLHQDPDVTDYGSLAAAVARHADQVLDVPVYAEPHPGTAEVPESALGAHWHLPDELDGVWPHLGLRKDAPREVKEVKLRELMRTPAWTAAPTGLRSQAEEFLGGN